MRPDGLDRETLAAWLAGALPGDEACDVEDRVRRSSELQCRAAALRVAMDALEPAPTPWRLPPPGRARGAAALSAVPALSPRMSRAGVRVEDVVEVRLLGAQDLGDRLVVLLRAGERGPWVMLAPGLALLRAFDRGEQGFVLPISVGAQPGSWRWAVALPDPTRLGATPGDARWEETLQIGIARGEVPVCTLRLEVSP